MRSETAAGEDGGGEEEGYRGTLPRHALRPRVIDVASPSGSRGRRGRDPTLSPLSLASEKLLSSTRRRPPPFYFWTRATDATRGLAIADINRYPSRNHRRNFSRSNRHSATTREPAEAVPTLDAVRIERAIPGAFASFRAPKTHRLASAAVSPSH